MRVKELTMTAGYTFQPEPFHSIRGEVSLTADIEEDEKLEKCSTELKACLMYELGCLLDNLLKGHGEVQTTGDPTALENGLEEGWDEDDE